MVVRTNTFTLYEGRTVSAINQGSTGFLLDGFEEAVILIDTTAVSGSSPTLDLDVEVSESGTDWFKLQDITQITAVAKSDAVKVSNFGKYLRLNNPATPGGGSSPSLTLTALLIAKGR